MSDPLDCRWCGVKRGQPCKPTCQRVRPVYTGGKRPRPPGDAVTCKNCGAASELELCGPCALKTWEASTESAKRKASLLFPAVMGTCHGPGEAVLTLLLLAREIHASQPGLPRFDFYVRTTAGDTVRIRPPSADDVPS